MSWSPAPSACRPRQTLGRDRCRGEAGGAIIEFALVMPLLFTLLLGTVSAGLAYNQKLSLTHGAREGARYGATHDLTDPTWAQTVAGLVMQRSAGELTMSQICVSLVNGGGASQQVYNSSSTFSTAGGGTACLPNDGSSDTAMRVQVTVKRSSKIEGILFSIPLSFNSSTLAKFEG